MARTNDELKALIRPLTQARYEVDTHWGMLDKTLEDMGQDYGLDLSPDFQRGHVWTGSSNDTTSRTSCAARSRRVV